MSQREIKSQIHDVTTVDGMAEAALHEAVEDLLPCVVIARDHRGLTYEARFAGRVPTVQEVMACL